MSEEETLEELQTRLNQTKKYAPFNRFEILLLEKDIHEKTLENESLKEEQTQLKSMQDFLINLHKIVLDAKELNVPMYGLFLCVSNETFLIKLAQELYNERNLK